MSQLTESVGNYKLIKRVKLDFTDMVVSKWKSDVTGLTVIHMDYEAPIVKGTFVVATEIFDDSGCPHALERLIFMGSERYPHKGILDLLANRAFSVGTNSWTAPDHTAYTLCTAGGQGFLQLLPIYVDHILYPITTNAAFMTEVHHIDGKGNDSGVVYCRMQGRENTSSDLMDHKLRHLLNPPGSSYRSITAGSIEGLRKLTLEQTRKYHASYYAPHNIALIVAGKLTEGTSSLLRVVQEQVEPNLIQHNQNKGSRPDGWKRPFVETPSTQRRNPIPATTKSIVEFPEKDERLGHVIIGFRGPPLNDFLIGAALLYLDLYLTSSTDAPFNKEYVEIESPLCSEIFLFSRVRATHVDLGIYIPLVPTKHLDTFNERLMDSLKRIVEIGIDMQRMARIINRDERRFRSQYESDKGGTFSHIVITDFLYGPEDGSELHRSMDEITYFNVLRSWTSSQWTALLSKYYIEQPSVVIVGKPSAKLARNIKKAEKARIASRAEKFGPHGLKELERKLEAAKAEHSTPVPTEILTSFPVPDVKSIFWIPVQSVQEPGIGREADLHIASTNGELQKHIESDGKPLPFFVEYDHVESEFVGIHGFFSLAKLPNRLRPYMSAYIGAFFSLPVVRRNGAMLTHEDVVNQLKNETVSYEVALGVSGNFRDTLRVSIKVEKEAYETAIAWLKDLLYGSQFDKERIQVVLAEIQQFLPERKQDGINVLDSLSSDLLYTENSTNRCQNVLQQAEFIPKLIRRLQECPGDVLADFESIRKHVIDPSGVRFSVTGNILGLKQPRSTWDKYFGLSLASTPLYPPVLLANQTLSSVGRDCLRQAIVMSHQTIESSFITLTTNCIQGFDHAEYPVIRLAIEVLNATKGYLWRHICEPGLAYTANVRLNVEAGLLDFSLHQSSNSMKAFDEAASMMRGLVDGSVKLDDATMAAAMSSIVYGVTMEVATTDSAAMESFVNQVLKGVPSTHHIDMLEKYRTIKKEDVLAALRKYFLPLFNPAGSVAVVVTASRNSQRVGEQLTGLGFNVTQKVLHAGPLHSIRRAVYRLRYFVECWLLRR